MSKNIYLYTTYHQDKSAQRNLEYIQCLKQNLNNLLIEKIFLMSEEDTPPLLHSKLFFIRLRTRPRFSDFFDVASQNNPSGLNIISNADIFFIDSDIYKIYSHLKRNEIYALSRWDLSENGLIKHYDFEYSQDCWIYWGTINSYKNLDFCLGKLGCDNRLAFELSFQGYKVLNPSKSIKSYHLHTSGIRNYTRNLNDTIPPPYLFIPCTFI